LGDANAALQAKLRQAPAAEEPGSAVSPPPSVVGRGLLQFTSSAATATATATEHANAMAQLRQDLAKSQHERGDLQTRLDTALKELEILKGRGKVDGRRMHQLNASLSQLTVKLKDREEELRGKAKLIENVQDENVTLNLQLNMVEEQSGKLKKENKELVDRWMARMGKEADRMNEEHKFG